MLSWSARAAAFKSDRNINDRWVGSKDMSRSTNGEEIGALETVRSITYPLGRLESRMICQDIKCPPRSSRTGNISGLERLDILNAYTQARQKSVHRSLSSLN
jgi:hypothetical protein